MTKKMTTAAVAASLVGGIAIGSFAAPPMAAFATDSSSSATANATARTPGQWITDSLKGLVDKGTITQQQSDTIASTLEAAEPKGGPHGGARPMDLSAIAKTLNMSDSDLLTALQTKSIADIAKDKNIDVQTVIDALVNAQNARLDQAVKDGKITQAEADQHKADEKTRITDFVNTVHKPGEGRGGRMGDGPDDTQRPARTEAGTSSNS